MNWKSQKGKSKIIGDVRAKGFSVRQSEKAVNAMFAAMQGALAGGESVEVPGGTIRVSKHNKPQRRRRLLTNVQTGEQKECTVQYPARVIRFHPDTQLDLGSAEEIEARQRASELLRFPVDEAIMAQLQKEGVDIHPHQPGALLRRLRELKKRSDLPCNTVEELVKALQFLYWL